MINKTGRLAGEIRGRVIAAPRIRPMEPETPKISTAMGRRIAGRKTRLTSGATSAALNKKPFKCQSPTQARATNTE